MTKKKIKKLKVVRKMPKPNGYIKRQRQYKTRAIQDKRTGLMKGRKRVRGYGDKTGIRRVERDFALVSPSKKIKRRGGIRKISKKKALKQTKKYKVYEEGEIVGRFR